MKVDITLTVGGTDVSIDYTEGKKLYLQLKSLYAPEDRESTAYSTWGDVADVPVENTNVDKDGKVIPCPIVNEDIETRVSELIEDLEKDRPVAEIIDSTDYLAEPDMSNDDMPVVDTEIKARMEQMQELINKMKD